jgi:hypothetical protein
VSYRKLIDGTKVEQLEKPVVLQIVTKCPSKYKLLDQETGEVYVGTNPGPGEKVKHWIRQE